MKNRKINKINIRKSWICLLGLLIGGFLIFQIAQTIGYDTSPNRDSRYLTMRDGTQIAIDVWYPADLAPNQKVPTIIRSTRYGRSYQRSLFAKLFGVANDSVAEAQSFNEASYALVLVDARGSGASFGQRLLEWSDDEVADLGEVVDWVVSQPWSDGDVGSYGVSYDGNTAELISVPNHPAVKAVAPQYSDFDPQFHLVMPGGVLNQNFIERWNLSNQALDANDICAAFGRTGLSYLLTKQFIAGIIPVDGALKQLAKAVASHNSVDVFEALQSITYRDDAFGSATIGDVSPYGRGDAIEDSGTPMYVWVSWLDAGTVDGAISRYLTLNNPQYVIIGPWNHSGNEHADPFLPPKTPAEPASKEQVQWLISFFDQHLKESGNGENGETFSQGMTYYTLGEGVWKTTNSWPPAGLTPQRWYFGPDGLLTPDPPSHDMGADEYTVYFTATTGDKTRWHAQFGGDVVYPDRAEEDKKLLTYTSEPLATDVEITGSPIVTLQVASTERDGAFHVT